MRIATHARVRQIARAAGAERLLVGLTKWKTVMPTVLNVFGFRFFFYSLEGTEPPHIHVEHGDKTAKLWIDPVELAGSRGFRARELNRIRALVIEHRLTFKEAWNEHFGPEV